jgi:hypothetical protein
MDREQVTKEVITVHQHLKKRYKGNYELASFEYEFPVNMHL